MTASQTAGSKGPITIQDFTLVDHLAAFDRERIPERVVHAKGAGAFGEFEVTNPEITNYCKAKMFESVGKKTSCAVRFSTVGGESGSAGCVPTSPSSPACSSDSCSAADPCSQKSSSRKCAP